MKGVVCEVGRAVLVAAVFALVSSCGRVGYDWITDSGPRDGGLVGDGSIATDGSSDGSTGTDGSSDGSTGTDGSSADAGGPVAGTLDPAFGAAGSFTFPMSTFTDVAVQADGRILVVGAANQNTFALRLLPDGTLDDTFNGDGNGILTGSEGSIEHDIGSGNNDRGNGIAVDSGGAITIAGAATVAGRLQGTILRLESDGALDDSFNGDGNGTLTAGEGYVVESDGVWNLYREALLLGSGEVLGVGTVIRGAFDDLRARRFSAAGGVLGTVDPFANELLNISGTVVGASQGYLAGGRDMGGSNLDLVLVRIALGSMTFDSAFAPGGTLEFSLGFPWEVSADIAQAIPGPRLYLAVGVANMEGVDNQPVVVATALDGSLDASFGGNGWVTLPSIAVQNATDVVPTDDGGVLAVIRVNGDPGSGPMGVARVRADGTLDPCFGDALCTGPGVVWLSGNYFGAGGAARFNDRLYVVANRDIGGSVLVGDLFSFRL